MEWGMPDIIHAHVVYPAGCGAVWLGKRFGIPVVLTEHTGPFSVYLSQSVQKGAVSDTLVGANRVLAVSPALAEQIHAVFPEVHVDILGNVVMTKFFEPQEINRKSNGTSETAFLCIALLNKGKGVDDLLRASMQLVREGVLSFELLIGGDGVELPRLKDVAEKLGLQAHCQFLGMLTRSEVKNWMQKTDVFVLPSLGETFGLVAAEAMACGKPVIATRCGGPEFLMTNETGVLVDRSDPPALAEAMKGFISGRAQFDSGHIRDHVKTRFGEEVFLQKLAAIYERVLEEVAGSKVRSEFG